MKKSVRQQLLVRSGGGLVVLLLAASGSQLAACGSQLSAEGAGFSLPVSFAEGNNDDGVARAGAPAVQVAEPARDHGGPPDPAPLVTRDYLRYRLRYSQREPALSAVEPFSFPEPVESVRQMGRFAIELWIGRELVERVRFDFPLVIEDPTADTPETPFEAGATVDHTVMVPWSKRATRAILVDRAGRRWKLPWPPDRKPNGPLKLTPLP